MKLETFFEHFDHFADAPNAAAKIRELVLDLAVRGSLVTQDASDASARELVESAKAERANLIDGRKIRAREVSPIKANETPFELPPSWVWARLAEVGHELGQKIPDKRFTYIDVGSIDPSKGRISDRVEKLEPSEAPSRARKLVTRGTVIYSTVRPYLLNVAIIEHSYDPEPIASTAFGILQPFTGIDSRFLFYWLRSKPFTAYAQESMEGMAYPAITDEKFYNGPIPVPPFAEQKRIVARVDDLMALCDRLEAQQQERETRQTALARAALARFLDAPTPANLNLIFHKSYTVDPADLRKIIHTLAIQGKLVPQDPQDEPVESSLPKLAAEAVDVPGSLFPSRWLRVPLAKAGEWRGGGTPSKHRLDYWRGDMPWVSPKDMKTPLIVDAQDHISDAAIEGSSVRLIPKGSILMVVRGMILARSFPVALTAREVTINQDMKALIPIESATAEFLLLVLRAYEPEVLALIDRSSHGTCKLRTAVLEGLLIPVPPLAEQQRIVAKVGELMALVGALESQLAAAQTAAENLFGALVAELTNTQNPDHRSTRRASRMTSTANRSTGSRVFAEPLRLSTRSFVLRRFEMTSGYRSLGEFDNSYHLEPSDSKEASPICLVGLNGSGKSNLIEAIAEVFCFLELINLPWKKIASTSSRYRDNRHMFMLEYKLEDDQGERLIRVRKTKKTGAEFFVVSADDSETPVAPGIPQLRLLPRRVIGYSSGLNETVSHPFLRTKTIYSEEVRDAAPLAGTEPTRTDSVQDTRTLYMDYESNAAILICNYIFQNSLDLAVIKEFTRVQGVASFGLRFNRKRAGKSGLNSIVRLTSELSSYLKSFALCAGAKYDDEQISYNLDFRLSPDTVALFRQEFGTAENLFMAMHKWSLLNALILSDEQRKVYLSNDISKGALERPPSVPPSDRVFNIVNLKLALAEPAIEIDYSGLSDGEHQFIQVFGTALLFSDPGTLFLFDEPESHFNPEWRTKFNLLLNKLPNASCQEYIISTHSPYIVSGSRRGNVYKFARTGSEVKCEPIDFETYGASFDVLLKKLFSIDSLIDQSARCDLEQIIKRGDDAEMQGAVEGFAESREKRRLYEAMIRKEKEDE